MNARKMLVSCTACNGSGILSKVIDLSHCRRTKKAETVTCPFCPQSPGNGQIFMERFSIKTVVASGTGITFLFSVRDLKDEPRFRKIPRGERRWVLDQFRSGNLQRRIEAAEILEENGLVVIFRDYQDPLFGREPLVMLNRPISEPEAVNGALVASPVI